MAPMAQMAAQEYYGGEKGRQYAESIKYSTDMAHKMAGTLNGQPVQPMAQPVQGIPVAQAYPVQARVMLI